MSRPALRIVAVAGQPPAPRPERPRGYAILYRSGERNFCPGCGREQWLIGRFSAECAWCGTAIDLAEAVR